jgi:hypothetical protein
MPCDIPAFCRNNYFTGKLLTERDLTAEQRYINDKLRLHHVALHGWGVICGLKVKSHPYCPHLRVIVEPGLAIDPCGRFIRVLKETEIELPKAIPLPPSQTDPCPSDSDYGYGQGSKKNQGGYGYQGQSQSYSPQQQYGTPAPQNYQPSYGQPRPYGPPQGESYPPPPTGGSEGYGNRGPYGPPQGGNYPRPGGSSEGYGNRSSYGPGGQEYSPGNKYDGVSPEQQAGAYDTGGQSQGYGQSGKEDSYQTERPYEQDYGEQSQPEQGQPCVNLYFCLTYAECEDEMMPAPFDECACTGNGQKPNRICETFKLTVSTDPPPGIDEVQKRRDMCLVDDCHDLYKTALDSCMEPTALDCLPLAIVEEHTLGEPVTNDQIDNWTVRPILPSTQLLDRLIYCMLDKVSTKSLTKIVDIGWNHRGEYHSHDFMRQFIGDGQTPKGFEITFGGPVRVEGITRRTFQAIAVRYADRYSGGQMEVAPARVRLSNDRMRAYLEIDRGYAERRLLGTRFDLFLLLRCGHVVDDNGLPVDGELLAKIDGDGNYIVAPPTGDGVEGGLFESWIRVMPELREEQRSAY